MGEMIQVFEVGKRYSHEQVFRSLAVGNAGGIRPCLGDEGEVRRLVIMTTAPDARILRENPYHDRIEGNVLVYTAAGLEGNQSVVGHNRRLVGQLDTPFPIYGFSNIGSRRDTKLGKHRWEFLGLLQYLRHYKEVQIDARSNAREVWVFEMAIHRNMNSVVVEQDAITAAEWTATALSASRTDEGDRVIARKPGQESEAGISSEVVEMESIRRRLLSLPPSDFEHLIKRVLELTGFERATVTRYSQDGGIDVNAYASQKVWPLSNLHVQVQAKRWIHSVGRREVAELRGSLAPFARGTIVTTGFFTRAALSESGSGGKSPIVLVDGAEFSSIVGALKLTD